MILLAVSAAAALIALVTGTEPRYSRGTLVASATVFALTVWIAVRAFGTGDIAVDAWHVDPLAALLMLVVGFVQLSATVVSQPYIRAELASKTITPAQARWYYTLVPLFSFSMFLTLAADNLGLMWIALEGTTLATTMLVAFYTKEGSLEAAWKYILICSAGISLGLIGVLLIFYASASVGAGVGVNAITWSGLTAIASLLPPPVMKLAFVFIFIGYGAKAGIVPLHTWLPDAHGRTPSPVSGMLSGVLLPVALYAIIRARLLVDLSLGSSGWTNGFFIVFGALTIIVSVAFMVHQRNYKRLLAYSSVEHVGFMVFGLGLGPVGIAATLVQIVGHALAKSALFFGTGNILHAYKSAKFEHVSAVARYLPMTAALFLPAMFMLLAAPPSPLFFSELAIVGAAIGAHTALAVTVLAAGVIAAAAFVAHLVPMFFVAREGATPVHATAHEHWDATHTVMAAHLVLLTAIGVALYTTAGQALLARIAAAI